MPNKKQGVRQFMAEPIRILHVFGALDRGGAETMIMNLYRKIDRRKIQFDFIIHTNKNCDFNDEIKLLGGRIYHIPRYKGTNHFQYTKAWHIFFKDNPEYKIIHGHVRSTASIYLKIAKEYDLITISHSHNTSSGIGISSIVKKILQYPIRYTADYLFACSKPAGEWLFGKRACQKDNFIILNNAIDAEKFVFNEFVREGMKKSLDIDNDKFVVGHIGRFHPQKNHNFIVDIFKQVYDQDNKAVLLLVGDGDLRTKIEKKVMDLGLADNVVFTGVRSDIPELMQVMDIFLFPSLYEGLGIVAIEAQAAGLKCIVADTLPNEAFVTDLIQKIPLNKNAQDWANTVLKTKNYTKRNTYNEIESKGFVITDTADTLQSFYKTLYNL